MTKIIRMILLFIGSILFLDGLILILKAKINFGTVIPFLLGLIFLIHAFYWTKIQSFLHNRIKLKRLWQSLWVAFLIWCASFFYFVWALQQKIDDHALVPPVKAMIVLGAGIEKMDNPHLHWPNDLIVQHRLHWLNPRHWSLSVVVSGLMKNKVKPKSWPIIYM